MSSTTSDCGCGRQCSECGRTAIKPCLFHFSIWCTLFQVENSGNLIMPTDDHVPGPWPGLALGGGGGGGPGQA